MNHSERQRDTRDKLCTSGIHSNGETETAAAHTACLKTENTGFDPMFQRTVNSAEELLIRSATERVASHTSNDRQQSASLVKINPVSSGLETMFQLCDSARRQRSLKSVPSDGSNMNDDQSSLTKKLPKIARGQSRTMATKRAASGTSSSRSDVEVPCNKVPAGITQDEATPEPVSSGTPGLRDLNAFSKYLGAQLTITQQTSSKWKNNTPLEQSRFEKLEGTNYVTAKAFDSLQSRGPSPFPTVQPTHIEIHSKEEPVAGTPPMRARLDLIPDRLRKASENEQANSATSRPTAKSSASDSAVQVTAKILGSDDALKPTAKSSQTDASVKSAAKSSESGTAVAQSLTPLPGLPEIVIAQTLTRHRASLGATAESPQGKISSGSFFDVQFEAWQSPFTQRPDGLFQALGDKTSVPVSGTIFGGSAKGTAIETTSLFDSVRLRPTQIAQAGSIPEASTRETKENTVNFLQTTKLPGSYFQKQQEKSRFDTSPSLVSRLTEPERQSDQITADLNVREIAKVSENSGEAYARYEDETRDTEFRKTVFGPSVLSAFAPSTAAENQIAISASYSTAVPGRNDYLYPFIVPVIDNPTMTSQLQHQVLKTVDEKHLDFPLQHLKKTATPDLLKYPCERTPQLEQQAHHKVSAVGHLPSLEESISSKYITDHEQNYSGVKASPEEAVLTNNEVPKESYNEPYMDSSLRLYSGEEHKGLTEFVEAIKKNIDASEALQSLPLSDDEIEVRSSKGMAALGVLQNEDHDEDGLFRTSEEDLLTAQCGNYYHEDNNLRGYLATDQNLSKSQVSGTASAIPCKDVASAQHQDNIIHVRHSRSYQEYPYSEQTDSLPLSERSENNFLEVSPRTHLRTAPLINAHEVTVSPKAHHMAGPVAVQRTPEDNIPSHLISRRSIADIIEEIVQHHISAMAGQRQEQAKKTTPESFRTHRPYQDSGKPPLSSGPTQVFYTSTSGKKIRDEYVSDYRHSLLGLPRRSRSNVDQTPGSPQREQPGGSTTSSAQHRGPKCTIKKLDPNVLTYLVEVTPPESGQENTSDMVMAEEQILVSEILDHITAPSVRTSSSGTKVSDQRPSIGLPSHTESLTRIRNAYAEAVAKRVLSKNLAKEIDNIVQDMPRSKLLEEHTAAAQKTAKLFGRRSSTTSVPSADEVIVNTAMVPNLPLDHATSMSRKWLEKEAVFAEQTKKEAKAEITETEAKLPNRTLTTNTDVTHLASSGAPTSVYDEQRPATVRVTISGTFIAEDGNRPAMKAAETREQRKHSVDAVGLPISGTVTAEEREYESASVPRTTPGTVVTTETGLVLIDGRIALPGPILGEVNTHTDTGRIKGTQLALRHAPFGKVVEEKAQAKSAMVTSTDISTIPAPILTKSEEGQATTSTQIGTHVSALEVPPSKKVATRTTYCRVCEGALPLEQASHSFLCFGRHDLANCIAAVPSESIGAFKLRIASDDDVKEVMLLPWKEEESTYTLSASTITRRMIYPNGFYVAVDTAQGNICGTASIILFDEEVAFCGFFHLLQGYTFKDLGLLLWNQMLHTMSGKNVYTVLPQDGSQELLLNYPFHVSTVSPIMFGPVRLTRNAYKRKVLTLNYKDKYFAALVSYDKHVFGFSRKRFLSSTLQEVGLDVKVATRNERNISGYGAVQKDNHGRPVLRWLMADDKDTAESLIHSLLQLFEPAEEVEIVGAFYTRNAVTRTLLDKVNICELRPWVLIYTRREPIYNYSRIAALTTV